MKLTPLMVGIFALQLMGAAGGPEVTPPCKATMPLLMGGDGKPVWMNSAQLLAQAKHCESPRFPEILRMTSFKATVVLSILIEEKGKPSCIRVVAGHPLVVGAAIDAARKWEFKPMTQNGKPVGFYGVLEFRFSMDDADDKGNSCLQARW
jgi:TonB family protein